MDFIKDTLNYRIELYDEEIWNFRKMFSTPEINRYPYPYLNALRKRDDGIHKVEPVNTGRFDYGNSYVITRYEDISELLRHSSVEKMRRVDENTRADLVKSDPIMAIAQNAIFFISGPDHQKMRGLVNKSFTPKIVSQLRPVIKALCEELGEKMITNDRFDFISAFGFQLPVLVIMNLLGIPEAERDKVREWTSHIVKPFKGASLDKSTMLAIFSAIQETKAYFLELCEEKRKRPQDDLISNLVVAEIDGECLNDDELYGTIILILVAGHETTTNAMGLSLLHMFRDKSLFDRLLVSHENIVNSVDEFLRFEPALTYTERMIHEDFNYRGHSFHKGENLLLAYGAANRDPRRFHNPETVMINRQNNKHLTFSSGSHYCLGAPLARAELEIAFDTILPKLRGFDAIGEEIETKKLGPIRGIAKFPFERR